MARFTKRCGSAALATAMHRWALFDSHAAVQPGSGAAAGAVVGVSSA
jgi:hypothetical protein